MTKRTTTKADHYYKVRVVLPGALIHLASTTEPEVKLERFTERISNVTADWLQTPECGDTVGYIDWPEVTAITWRWTGA